MRCWKVGYNGSAAILHAVTIDGLFFTSTDGGTTWKTYNVTGADIVNSFAIANDHTLYANSFTSSGSIVVSTDLGNTWSSTAGTFNGDSWTLSVDSCNPKQLYLANEECYVNPSSDTSNFYLSQNGGQTWQITDSHITPYLSGSMSTTVSGIFLGTRDGSGVHRSMDGGMTWKAIGGPSNAPDTRNIAAVNNNIILAADKQGNIWLTTNGGGDSVQIAPTGGLGLTPSTLFSTDSIECSSVVRSIQITRGGCSPPSLDSAFILGTDSASYRIDSITSDSITITLTPQGIGVQNALLVGQLDNGTNDTVLLAGVGAAAHVLTLVASSTTQHTDTIGATVGVPITIDGLARAETVEIVLHYPLPDLQYVGSFDPSGTQVDVPDEQWPGRSLLRIANAEPNAVAAYARFNVFSDTDYDPVVTFDSLDVTTATTSCEYSIPPAITDTIVPLEGCGIPMLSQWIHLGTLPLFSILPNPTTGTVELNASIDMGNVWVDVYDVLGLLRGQFPVTLQKNVPVTLSLPFESGLYFLRIASTEGESHVAVIINK